MKRKLFKVLLLVVVVSAAIGWNFSLSKSKAQMSELALANIDALAYDEGDGNTGGSGTVSKTESCKLTFPDGTFTSSVRRACYNQYVCPSCSCTPVKCGDSF